jgi:hypothetical protein
MTADEQQQPTDAQSAPTMVEDVYGGPDSVLAALVSTVNRFGSLEIGVTLHVSGVVVSGLLISGRSFFELLSAALTEGGTSESAPIRHALASAWAGSHADDYRAGEHDPSKDDQREEGQPAPKVGYIHLRSASVHAAGDLVPLPGVLWRGRLSHVSGWAIGNFGQIPPLPGDR